MKIVTKLAAFATFLSSGAAMAATPQAVADACCAIGLCCGLPCC
jgi:hypothetical protein